MAVALVTAGSNFTNAAFSATYSATVSGSDTVLLVGVMKGANLTTIDSVTYNGTALTQINTQSTGGSTFGQQALYYLKNPTTGANNIVITCSGGTAHYIYSAYGIYSGVDQTTAIEPSGGNTSSATATSVAASVTTVADNDWVVGIHGRWSGAAGTITAGTNTTLQTSQHWCEWIDTNAAQTPAGSKTVNINNSSSELMGLNIVAIRPVQTPTSTGNFFSVM